MKKITTLLFTMLTMLSFSQTTYNFEVERDATNSKLFTVFAVPDAAGSNVDFVSGVLIFKLNTGGTIKNITSLIGNGWETEVQTITADQLTNASLGDGTKDVYGLLSDTGQTFLDHKANERFGLVSLEITGDVIEFVENTDPLIESINNLNFNFSNALIINSKDAYGNLIGDTVFKSTLSAENFIFSKVSMYPNPVLDTFNIQTGGITIDAVQIYNINGTLVKTIDTNAINNAINISDLNSGVYFLQLTSGNSKNTMKLVKQ